MNGKMDAHTLELLEFNKVRELVAGYAACSLGKALARQAEPLRDPVKIRDELALVTEMTGVLALGQSPPFGGVHDVRLLARRAAIGAMLTADQLLEVGETLASTGHMFRYRMRLSEQFQRLIELLTPVEDLGVVAKNISGCIDSRGHVLDMASPALANVRQKLAEIDEKVQHQIKKLLRDPRLREILRYPNATVSGDHYVLPVDINHRHKIPGVVHRTSGTGETVFIEPASVANLSAERTVLKGEEEREVRKVLRKLSTEVGKVARQLSVAVETMGRLDYVTARARYSRDYGMSCPDLNTEGRVWLRLARHPLLEHLFRNGKVGQTFLSAEPAATADRNVCPTNEEPRTVVPIDVRLGHGFNLLIITGPNTGGKTVTLKTTGLICLMALAGMHIPAADGSQVPVFHEILADIGDEQSLEQSLSTFSSHISRIAHILKSADDKSLVLLDELGAGTDPTEGAALGRAILDELDRIGCRAMVTTHLGDLKTYAFNNDRAENAAVEFDVETLRPTYRLHIGQFGMSNALKIARRLKLPRDLLRRATSTCAVASAAPGDGPAAKDARGSREGPRGGAAGTARGGEAARGVSTDPAKGTARGGGAEGACAARARLQPNDLVQVPRFGKPGKIVRIDHKRNQVVVSVGLGQWEVPLDEVFPVAT